MGEKVHILKPYHWSAKGDAFFFPFAFLEIREIGTAHFHLLLFWLILLVLK